MGQLANLSNEQLTSLIEEDRRESIAAVADRPERHTHGTPASFVTGCLVAVRALDPGALKTCIDRAVIALPPEEFIDQVATPLMHRIGDLWHGGQLNPGHEHLASSVMRNTLAALTSVLQPESGEHRIVVATPSGERHEIAAVLVAAAAQLEGWEVTYLGPDLPASDIAQAVEQTNADVVALSVTVMDEGAALTEELQRLRSSIAAEVTILVGGQAVEDYQRESNFVGATFMKDLSHVRTTLRELAASTSTTEEQG